MTIAATPVRRRTLSEARPPAQLEDWLRQLQDLTWLHIAGQDSSRLRIVSALLHGNEPSSIRAVHRFLRAGEPPATDLWVLLGAVRAAIGPPLFGRRFLSEDGDLNRVWRAPFVGMRGGRVQQLLAHFLGSGAEALIDIHNNTGHNPPYGVGPDDSAMALGLASLFGKLFVHTPLRMGTLMEATAGRIPSVSIECGRAGDPAADEVAVSGLTRFLQLESLCTLEGQANDIRVLGDPVRVTLCQGATLRFSEHREHGADLTLDPQIDRHNFCQLHAGYVLGWLGNGGLPLIALDGAGVDRANDLFTWGDGRLRVATPWIPVMMTTSPSAAISDCLFYAVYPRPAPERPPTSDQADRGGARGRMCRTPRGTQGYQP